MRAMRSMGFLILQGRVLLVLLLQGDLPSMVPGGGAMRNLRWIERSCRMPCVKKDLEIFSGAIHDGTR
jgi:hypothetical protein